MAKKICLLVFVILFFHSEKSKAVTQIDSVLTFHQGCDYLEVRLYASGGNNLTATIDFGDGSSIEPMQDSSGCFYGRHYYLWFGTYTVKSRLYENGVLVDSAITSFNRNSDEDCGTASNYVYLDINNNCTRDSNEMIVTLPLQVEIASSSSNTDTLSFIGGFNYVSSGFSTIGDIFYFRILPVPQLTLTCPSNGILYDTIQSNSNVFSNHFAANCATSDVELAVDENIFQTAANRQKGYIYLSNALCHTPNVTVTLTHSPKYQYVGNCTPIPSAVNGNILTWNYNDLSAVNVPTRTIYYELEPAGVQLTVGDTVQTKINITPLTNDIDPANNSIIVVDTVSGPYDPNAIYVKPEGCVVPGTNLQYKITFENLGNAPAVNVFVLDTLPAGLDANTLQLLSSTHNMYITQRSILGKTILRFDFPNIMLADSSDHDGRHGMFQYKINSKSNWPIGSSIDHRVGIYFDYNEVVMTNTAQTGMCWPAVIGNVNEVEGFLVYPNPASEALTIRVGEGCRFEITNALGQAVDEGELAKGESQITIRALPPGIYNIRLETSTGVSVQRFQKL